MTNTLAYHDLAIIMAVKIYSTHSILSLRHDSGIPFDSPLRVGFMLCSQISYYGCTYWVPNTLAYYDLEMITDVKGFKALEETIGQYYKLFTAIITQLAAYFSMILTELRQ